MPWGRQCRAMCRWLGYDEGAVRINNAFPHASRGHGVGVDFVESVRNERTRNTTPPFLCRFYREILK